MGDVRALKMNWGSGSLYLSLVNRERILSEYEGITIWIHSLIIEVNLRMCEVGFCFMMSSHNLD